MMVSPMTKQAITFMIMPILITSTSIVLNNDLPILRFLLISFMITHNKNIIKINTFFFFKGDGIVFVVFKIQDELLDLMNLFVW